MIKQTLEQKIEALTPSRLIKWLAFIFAAAAVAVVVVLFFYFNKFHGKLSTSNADWGAFGDFVGGTLSPVLSFFGLIALLLTIVLQSKELESTTKELERAASAQENTEKLLSEQTKTQAKQQFEGTFFSLLEQHNKALEKFSTSTERSGWRSDLDTVRQVVFSQGVKDLTTAKVLIEKRNNICGHYFRILYQLLKFIATNCPCGLIGQNFINDKIESTPLIAEEKMYSNIVRASIDHNATQLLAVNCFCLNSTDTYWRYKLLIERYSFLEHMPFEIEKKESQLLLDTMSFYKETAFGSSVFVKKIKDLA